MPNFPTPEPISAAIDVPVGDVRITAGDRDETVVDVRPSDASNAEDRKAAEQTRIDFANGQLIVKAPKLRHWLPRNKGGSIDVVVELPAGSDVHGSGQMTDFRSDGPLGDCRIKVGIGQIQLDAVDTPRLRTGVGDIEVGRSTGHAEITAGTGDVRVRELDATAAIKNSNGDTWVGEAAGELRLNAANGSIAVDTARAGVVAKSANGDVRLGEAAHGSVVLETKLGDVEVGIPEGTAAWLDLHTVAGRVHNALEAAEAPGQTEDRVEVRARTSTGSVVVRRP
jgi:putative adhesin